MNRKILIPVILVALFCCVACKSQKGAVKSDVIEARIPEVPLSVLIEAADSFQKRFADSLSYTNRFYIPESAFGRNFDIRIDSAFVDDISAGSFTSLNRTETECKSMTVFHYMPSSVNDGIKAYKIRLLGEEVIDVYLILPAYFQQTPKSLLKADILRPLFSRMGYSHTGFVIPMASFKIDDEASVTFTTEDGVPLEENPNPVSPYLRDETGYPIFIPDCTIYTIGAPFGIIITDPKKSQVLLMGAITCL